MRRAIIVSRVGLDYVIQLPNRMYGPQPTDDTEPGGLVAASDLGQALALLAQLAGPFAEDLSDNLKLKETWLRRALAIATCALRSTPPNGVA